MSTEKNYRRLSKASKLFNISKAIQIREMQCEEDDAFDPLRFIEFSMAKLVANFEYDINEFDQVFEKAPSTLAYVDLTSNPVLVMRESVVERSIKGSPHDRFVLAHEIGHVIRHRFSGKRLAQHKIGSPERNRTDNYLEREANLFGGMLLVPPSREVLESSIEKISREFIVSKEAARFAMIDAAFWAEHKPASK